jgi:hypothetical protein
MILRFFGVYFPGTVDGAKLHTDGYVGHARLVIDEDKKIVVGATFIGPQV